MVREAVARNQLTPTAVLEKLVCDPRPLVRIAVAENPGRHAIAVALTASDPKVRAWLVGRKDLRPEHLDVLLNDPLRSVRAALAAATDDVRAVARLSHDPDPSVRATVTSNPLLRAEELLRLASDRIARVRAAAAGSRRLPPETLTLMAGDGSAEVRWSVLVNNPERLDLARRIAEDRDEMNAHQARAQLERPRQFTAYLSGIELVE